MKPRTIVTLAALSLALADAHAQTAPTSQPGRDQILGRGGNARDLDMAPDTRVEVVRAAVAAIPATLPAGPVEPTWDSLAAHYAVPAWFQEARFGLFIHWGVFSVPAHHNEWYEKHMYGNAGIRKWHVEKFGDGFGYADFIPMFKAERFDPADWAACFADAGVRYVIAPAQHHENFAMWASAVTPFNAGAMGPKRDVLGELMAAIRAKGLKVGVANHGIESFTFIAPPPALRDAMRAKNADLFDPKWAGFYHVADQGDAACQAFLVDWARRNVELIDKYAPDLLWFDNGVDQRFLDPLKLWVAAYYYNAAAARGQAVTLSTKKAAMAPSDDNAQTVGSALDFEKVGGRSPAGIRPGAWQVDDPIASNTWGYTDDMRLADAASLLNRLADTASKNGNYLLNISPRPDGTIPDEQRAVLKGIGAWLRANGDAIYGTHAWTRFGDGGLREANAVRFTVRGDALYAIVLNPTRGRPITIANVNPSGVGVVGLDATIDWSKTADGGVRLTLPDGASMPRGPIVLSLRGATVNPPPFTRSGNPE